jgi:hypothetical protein
VRTYKDATSPWGVGVYYDDGEFESMMDEVRTRAGADVFTVGKGVDIDLVLLRVYELSPDLVTLPEGVLGRTIFQPDGHLDLHLSRELADEAEDSATARRRLRSTLAHEGAHIALHRHLYCLEPTRTLFGETAPKQAGVLCRGSEIKERAGDYSHTKEWWEYQANRGMSALLLPAKLLHTHVEGKLKSLSIPNMQEALRLGRTEEVVRAVAAAFDVSFEMTIYRLQERGWLGKQTGQLELGLGLVS